LRITKPITEPKDGRNLRRERRRWDDADRHTLPLGCVGCTERDVCGGIHKKQLDYYCLGDCCGNPASCDNVCPRNFEMYVDRFREVDGFDLNNIPRATPCLPPELPAYVPMVFHPNRREALLDVPAVALPLHKFYSRRDGALRYTTRAEIEAAFRLKKNARIILVGCGRDKPIEVWWGLSTQRRTILRMLADLGIELVTSPNYSLFTDVPRHDNLFNIKRIGLTWFEAVDSGMPCGLHLNARTQHDYARLASFVKQRAEVTDVAFEFKTGGAWRSRRAFHHAQLADFARAVAKPLRLHMIGGLAAIPILAPAYAKLTYIDTSAFMKAMYRQRLVAGNEGNLLGVPEPTEKGAPVDGLFMQNIETMRAHVEWLISESCSKASWTGNAPPQEIPETDSSAQAAPGSSRAASL
jgi:hypothetical protein